MATKMKDYFNADTAKRLGAQLGIDGEEYAAWVAPRVEGLEILDRVTVFAQGASGTACWGLCGDGWRSRR